MHAPAVLPPPSLGIDEGSVFDSREAVASLLRGPRPPSFVTFTTAAPAVVHQSQGRGARHVHALVHALDELPAPTFVAATTDLCAPTARAAIVYL